MSTELSTRDEAVARAERIRAGILSLTDLQADIAAAYQAQDWTTLGYNTWEDYITGEYGGQMPRLDKASRRELVVNLRGEGLSTRALAVATGQSQANVRNDLTDAGEQKCSPAPVTGRDGKTYTPTAAPTPEQKPHRRRPLLDRVHELARKLNSDTRELKRIGEDDRFGTSAPAISAGCLTDLERTAATLNAFIDMLDPEGR